MSDSSEYYSFEKALRELNMKEADLKRLVSEGEIRAFRDQDNMKFKKADVEKLRRSGPSDASAETLADDLIFDEDEDLDLSDDEPGMATEKISSADTLETLGGSDFDDDDEEEILESESGVRRATGRATRVREAQAAGQDGTSPLFMAVLIFTAIFLFYGIFVMIDTSRSTETGMTEGFTNFVTGMFGGNE